MSMPLVMDTSLLDDLIASSCPPLLLHVINNLIVFIIVINT